MTKYNIPLTYKPKIPFVLDGTCRQTIRAGRKFKVGDLISFHGWERKPYHSKWSFRTPYFTITEVQSICVCSEGIKFGYTHSQSWDQLGYLAQLDGIIPPTGEELYKVLATYHKLEHQDTEMQIIRW